MVHGSNISLYYGIMLTEEEYKKLGDLILLKYSKSIHKSLISKPRGYNYVFGIYVNINYDKSKLYYEKHKENNSVYTNLYKKGYMGFDSDWWGFFEINKEEFIELIDNYDYEQKYNELIKDIDVILKTHFDNPKFVIEVGYY